MYSQTSRVFSEGQAESTIEYTLKVSCGPTTVELVPQPLEIEDGPADELVRLSVNVPRWMKNEVIGVVGRAGKSLNDFVRDAVRVALEEAAGRGGASARGRRRPGAGGRRGV